MSEYKMPLRPQDSNKGTFGKVLNFAGSNNFIGAAFLSTLAILKAGAGYTALSSDEKVLNSVSQTLPEAVYLTRKEGLKTLNNYTVILIGCGLGTGWSSTDVFLRVITSLQNSDMPVIIDADGLNILSRFKNRIILPCNTIITPHPLEAARLLGKEPEEVLNNLEPSAKELSLMYNCVTVLKTHRTIICKDEKIHINEHGNSALAKAGSGDVLAGIISGFLAQKMMPFEAAKLGVYLHSRAGEIASQDLTEYSVLASDIIKYLPSAIKEIN